MSQTGTALIVVDMSVEQVADIKYNSSRVIDNCRRLASSCSVFDIKVDSRLWLTSPKQSSLADVWPGTATEMFVADSHGASLIPQLRDNDLTFCRKYNYSCFAGEECQLLQLLRDHNVGQVYICGINTDYCVFATALDAFQYHFKVTVVQDAVTSVRGKEAHEEGLRNIERHFSKTTLLRTQQVLSSVE